MNRLINWIRKRWDEEGGQIEAALGLVWIALAFYGAICVFRDVSATYRTPIKTYVVRDHIWTPKIAHVIQVRSYPEGWWRKYEAIIDDWEDTLAGFASPEDAFRGAQARTERADKEEAQ
jgi:hypothetical protein